MLGLPVSSLSEVTGVRSQALVRAQTTILTVATNGLARRYSSCIATHREFSERYGYRHLLIEDACRALTANESAWLRLPVLRILIEYGPVLYIDADAEFRPGAPPIETVHAPGKSVYMAFGRSRRYNSGVIYLRDTGAVDFLDDVLANYGTYIPVVDRAPYENGHIIHFARKHAPVISRLDERWNNSESLELCDYIRHYTNSLLYLRPGYISRPAPRPRTLLERICGRLEHTIIGPARSVLPRRPSAAPYRLLSLACTILANQAVGPRNFIRSDSPHARRA